MNVIFTRRFWHSYHDAPESIQRAFDKQLAYLLEDLRHPSLRSKKYDRSQGIWQARVDRGWRFYFTINADTYEILDMISHPK